MGLGVLLVPALAGYLFLNWFNGTRYSLPRETGYHVVFRAAIVGVFLFFIARLCVLLASTLIPQIGQSWKTVVPLDYSGTAAATIVLAALLPLVLNQFPRYDRFQAQQKAAVARWRPDQPDHRPSHTPRPIRGDIPRRPQRHLSPESCDAIPLAFSYSRNQLEFEPPALVQTLGTEFVAGA